MFGMYTYHVDSFDENCWPDLLDYSCLLDDDAPPLQYGNPQPLSQNVGSSIDVSISEITSQVKTYEESGFPKKRGRTDPYVRTGTKACRERMRREKLNDRFSELSSILEPGRPVKTDKFAILGDAIRHLNHLKTESQEYIETNKQLMEEIKILKAEKNELREEKVKLKADKERMEQQVKTMNIVTTTHSPEVNKMTMFPSYGFVPMWQYLPNSARDTSQDQILRPPAA
ncbi:hypothetical protein ACS0TY_014445 [Phlomoides rotata]